MNASATAPSMYLPPWLRPSIEPASAPCGSTNEATKPSRTFFARSWYFASSRLFAFFAIAGDVAEAARGGERRVRVVALLRVVHLPDARVRAHDRRGLLELLLDGRGDAARERVPDRAAERRLVEPRDAVRARRLDVLARRPEHEAPAVGLDVRAALVRVGLFLARAVVANDRDAVVGVVDVAAVLALAARVHLERVQEEIEREPRLVEVAHARERDDRVRAVADPAGVPLAGRQAREHHAVVLGAWPVFGLADLAHAEDGLALAPDLLLVVAAERGARRAACATPRTRPSRRRGPCRRARRCPRG